MAYTYTMMKLSPTGMIVVGALAILAVVVFVAWRVRRQRKIEYGVFDKIGNAIKTAAGAVVKTGLTIKEGAVAGYKSVTGQAQEQVQQQQPAYVATFSGREFDKYDWSCPWWTVESGNPDNSKACYKRPYTSPAWRDRGDGNWGWSCPNGTTPTGESEWEKQCAVGYTGKVSTDEGWKCPPGTNDTGKTWENSSWHEAHKQCERTGPYTTRISVNKKWVCPPGSKDTGLTWTSATQDDPDRGFKQCKWTGP